MAIGSYGNADASDRSLHNSLPPAFLVNLAEVADAYLTHSDPILQSGFGGGADRWRTEREPILDGIARSGSLIDIGCANGYLLECLVLWGRERGIILDPYGLDCAPKLIDVARTRLPRFAAHFLVGNAWMWIPPGRFDFVYTLYDNVPESFLARYVEHLKDHVAEPDGRVIIGAYGSRSKHSPAFDVDKFLRKKGIAVAGGVTVGNLPEARFAWVDPRV